MPLVFGWVSTTHVRVSPFHLNLAHSQRRHRDARGARRSRSHEYLLDSIVSGDNIFCSYQYTGVIKS